MKFQSINPATEEVFGEFEGMNLEQAVSAAQTCKQVQKKWVTQTTSKRAEFFKKMAKLLRAENSECAKLMTLEMGKPITQSKAEIEKCAWVCEFYAGSAAEFLKEEPVKTEAKKSYIRFDPLGVVLAIMPWNFPFWQVFRCAVPAMMAGNGVVLKHASNVPQCSLKMEELFHKAGFPDGLFKALLINPKIAEQLIEKEVVDAVSLTGSTDAGSAVAANAGKHLKKVVLELGGSDPFIVLADADTKTAAQVALQARMVNVGQSCIAAKRFILEKPIAEEFEKQLIENFKTLKMGDPMDETVNMGPLAKKEMQESLERQVKDAASKGAKVLAGGSSHQGKGFFFEPTLLSNVTKDMAVFHEEVFGPVMALIVVADRDEAVKVANNSEFGLGAALWTSNLELAESLAAEIESGFVSINGMVKSDPRLPFGGIKKSGFGRELGSYGIKEFVNIKTVVIN